MIRNAMADDVSALVEIENRAFTSDGYPAARFAI